MKNKIKIYATLLLLWLSIVLAYVWWYQRALFLDFHSLYEQKEYQAILESFSWANSAEELFNLWNTSYSAFLYENSWDVSLLEDALKYYSGSLSIEEHPNTRHNYDFVNKLLDTIQNESVGENIWGIVQDDNEEGDSNNWSGSSITNTWRTWERDEQYLLQEEDTLQWLTPEQKEELSNYIHELKKEQLRNQKYFWKVSGKTRFEEVYENFMWGINRGWEKDW